MSDGDRAGEQMFLDAGDARLAGEVWHPEGDLQAIWAFFKREHDYDPIPDCLALRCPHLAIFGSADPLVPVEESAAAFTAAACTTGRHPLASLTIHVVPGADHRLRTGADAVPAAHHLACLCGWITIAAQAGRGPVSDRAG